MQILPLENANGRKLVESGQLCERKNGRGVDPNRNWDAHWGFKESDYDPAEEYPGAAPFRSAPCGISHRCYHCYAPFTLLTSASQAVAVTLCVRIEFCVLLKIATSFVVT